MMGPPPKRPRCEHGYQPSILELLNKRELRASTGITFKDFSHVASRLPVFWRKLAVDPGQRNKIFASQWITNNHIVYGTKCNELVLYDCSTGSSLSIPLISSNDPSHDVLPACTCGVHAIQKNPSSTLLATGASNVNNVGIYTLNDFAPHCLLKDCHTDWVFDLRWLDDRHLASCSRDSSVAIWRIPESAGHDPILTTHIPSARRQSAIPVGIPVGCAKSELMNDRFRAMELLTPSNYLAVVSMSRRLYLYDAVRLGSSTNSEPVYTLVLPEGYQEAVALRRWPSNPNCIAMASHFCVVLFDIRCSKPIEATGSYVYPSPGVSGIRSLNFSGDVLSYGASNGKVYFYDLRGSNHLPVHLDIGPGWVKPNVCIPTTHDPFSVQSGFESPPAAPPTATGLLTRSDHIRVHVNNEDTPTSVSPNRRFAALLENMARRRSLHQQAGPVLGMYSGSRRRTIDFRDFEDRVLDSHSSVTNTDEVERNRFPRIAESLLMHRARWPRIGLWQPLDIPTIHESINNPFVEFLSEVYTSPTPAHRMVAVYTHEYDLSGTRLFTAGGPISSSCHGNAAALWE